ncbi:ABC-type Na+ efflux pump, permease component [Halovenus aranensis]|uniref:ABC-type Na+ efflux pump, permease component n=1 Tax=Halovenus aranensis TaxID=890420 RepID=A0A1G8V5B4_9EURY|nr:ABC transporter permease [Halovenus aranensis]SDJ61272.1 ABC-type Na+ efflux pump, permease component [Halovenus aranensis]
MFDHPRWTITKRELGSLSREKTIVLAICIQLFIAAFSSFLVVGLTSLYDPGSVDGGADIEVGVPGDVEENLIRAGQEVDGVTIRRVASNDDALELFERGQLDAVVSTASSPVGGGTQVQVEAVVPAEDLRTTVIVVSVRELLSELERLERVERVDYLDEAPVQIPEDVGSSSYFGFTYTILLPLLLFLPAFISGSIVVDSITEEIEQGTLELLRVSPLSLVDIVDGKAAGMVAIAPIQAGLWMVLLRLNGTGIENVGVLLVFVAAMTLITVVVGTMLGLLTGQRRQAQLLYSLLAVLLFGGTIALPEHPASTVALLAVDSATGTTLAHVAGFTVLGIGLYACVRWYVGRVDVESL